MNAIKQFHIPYPVGQDNNYDTWNNYNNQYWPAEYLIDSSGNIRREDFGEGNYPQMEQAIQKLLKDAGKKLSQGITTLPDQTPTNQISPETYLGSTRMEYYYPSGSIATSLQDFILHPNIPINTFSLGGNWDITNENATTEKNAILEYHFYASKVYIILNPPTGINALSKCYLMEILFLLQSQELMLIMELLTLHQINCIISSISGTHYKITF